MDGMILSSTMLTPAQCRAARALLGVRQVDLAEWAGVSSQMVKRYEKETHDIRATVRDKIELALVAAGVELINEPGRVGAVLKS